MNAKIVRAIFLVAFVLVFVSFVLPLSPAWADGPIQGLPLPTTVPWPAAQPLKLGVPSSAGTFSPSPSSNPVQIPLTVGVLNPPSVPGPPSAVNVVPQNIPAGAIYVTPVPSSNSSSAQSVPVINSAQAPVVNSGNTKIDALFPNGSLQILGAGATAWYLIGSGGPYIQVSLWSEPHLNVTLDIFAPNQSSVPIGRGTPLRTDPTTLFWSGGSWRTSGNWYARITNYYPAPIQYRITSSATQIGTKDCYSYWEYIGTDHVYWTQCN